MNYRTPTICPILFTTGRSDIPHAASRGYTAPPGIDRSAATATPAINTTPTTFAATIVCIDSTTGAMRGFASRPPWSRAYAVVATSQPWSTTTIPKITTNKCRFSISIIP